MQTYVAQTSRIRELAADYLRRGWSVLPIPYRSKKPTIGGWERLRLTETDVQQYFEAGAQNIGVLLGAPSGWLIDVDLDHPLAVDLARGILPATGARFGRASKLRSHWLYVSSRPVATKQWRLPDRRMIVELRSTGAQTVFPGSVHASGEPIEWDTGGEPARIDPQVLVSRLSELCDEVHRLSGAQRRESMDRPLPTAPSGIVDRARKYLSKIPPAVSGQGGHDATFHAACVLVIGFGLDRDSALRLLREWNETCQPPWSERELKHKVDDALKQPGWRGYLLTRRPIVRSSRSAIERANRHAIAHRRRARRRTQA